MQLIALTLAAALSSPITQDAAALPSPIAQDAALEKFDWVEVIVNDEILTFRQLMRVVHRKIRAGVNPTEEEFVALTNRVGRDLMQERLQTQGGVDMGFEPQEVERRVTNLLERRINDAGGAIQLADELSQSPVSLNDQKVSLRREIYQQKWEKAITGLGVGVKGRVYRDRYVRPGKLQLHYEQLKNGRLGVEAIGGTPALYSLQELILPISSEADAEQVRVQAERLSSELSRGADFTQIIRAQPRPTENDGMLPQLTGIALVRSKGKDSAIFAISAATGEVSKPIPDLSRGRLTGWRIMKLIKTEKPILPSFSDPKIQAALRRTIQKEMDSYRRDVGIQALRDGAFIWPDATDQNT